MNFFIQKILKNNLNDLKPTDDIILSVVDNNQLYCNNKNGEQKLISSVVPVETEDQLMEINNPDCDKIYLIKKTGQLCIVKIESSGTKKFVDLNKQLKDDVEKINIDMLQMNKSINTLNVKMNNIVMHINSPLIEGEINKLHLDDIKNSDDDEVKINYIKVMSEEKISKDIVMKVSVNNTDTATTFTLQQGTTLNKIVPDLNIISNGYITLEVVDKGDSPKNIHIIMNVSTIKNKNKII